MKLIFIICIVSFMVVEAFASESFFNKKDFQFALGGQINSLLYKRGMITYAGEQVFPIYSISLFSPKLLLVGSALYYKTQIWGDNFHLRSRLNMDSTKDHPLYYSSEREDVRVKRDKTSEFDLYLEYTNSQNIYLRIQSSTDMVANKGQYYELYSHFPIYNFSKGEPLDSLFQLGFIGSIGLGDKKHNEYLYGVGAQEWSFNNVEYGLTLRSPKVIDMFWPAVTLSNFQILGEGNQKASFVQETSGWVLQALMAFRIL